MTLELNYAIGLRVKRAREASGLTQERLADLVDRSKEAISNIERGVNMPGLDTLTRICDVTGFPLAAMVSDGKFDREKTDLIAQLEVIFAGMKIEDLRLSLSILKLIATRGVRSNDS